MKDKRLIGKIRMMLLGCLCGCCLTIAWWNQNNLQRSLRLLTPNNYYPTSYMDATMADATDDTTATTTMTTTTTTTATTTTIDFTNYAFALMTEPRCYAATPFVLDNALTNLPETFKVVVFYSLENEQCMRTFVRNSTILQQAYTKGRLILRHDIPMHANISGNGRYNPNSWNNALYSNPSWWESLLPYGEMVLTLQSDTLLCSLAATEVQPWHRVNLLGGISAQVRYKIWTPPDVRTLQASNRTNVYHLNGGLSIRRIPWVASCLRSYRGPPEVEDRVFHNCTNGRESATIVDAMAFASDSGHTLCFDWEGKRKCPWGVHKPWAAIPYNHRDEEYEELVQYCPDINKLRDLQYDIV